MTDATGTTAVRRPRRPVDTGRIPAGWRVIGAKELADHLLSIRFLVLLLLLGLIGVYMVYTISGVIRDVAEQAAGSRNLFLALFAGPAEPTAGIEVTFVGFVTLLGPLLGIAFGFDAVSTERAEGTLPRLVSQPIHRDDVINGKFAAGLAVIVLILAAVMLVISGVALVRLGVVPSADELIRLVTWFLVGIVYVGAWLAFATLCSVVFQRAATAALVTISAWIVLVLFWSLIGQVLAELVAPVRASATVDAQLAAYSLQQNVLRLSPAYAFTEVGGVLLDPSTRTLGIMLPDAQARPTLLPYGQSVLLIWPHIVGLLALTVVCFAAAYIAFMRQEVRA